MHYCFKFLYESGIHEDLDHLDLYALLIGALCHDCDHRGFPLTPPLERYTVNMRESSSECVAHVCHLHHIRGAQISLKLSLAVTWPSATMTTPRLRITIVHEHSKSRSVLEVGYFIQGKDGLHKCKSTDDQVRVTCSIHALSDVSLFHPWRCRTTTNIS
eukprot:2303591-Amphidinium_carterae.1